VGNLTGFILAGHSFGGYICGHYACKYPQHIKKLLMLSPAGLKGVPENYEESFKKSKEKKSMFFSLVETGWEK
jgi:pimeloyl-ACP methyl ester carboxylesterase